MFLEKFFIVLSVFIVKYGALFNNDTNAFNMIEFYRKGLILRNEF